jgi:SNF2 family DNA or RNA helicase
MASLPEKTEVILYTGMTALQKKYYRSFLLQDLSVFDAKSKNKLLNTLMQVVSRLELFAFLTSYSSSCASASTTRSFLRSVQFVISPHSRYLFDGVEPEPFEIGDHLVEASGKMALLDALLPHLKQHGHRVLIFSQVRVCLWWLIHVTLTR